MKTMSMGDMGYSEGHEIGNKECPSCWNKPEKCDYCENGLVHTCFGDESSDGDYYLNYKCDMCG